jgi:hypothetical protein
MGKVERPGNVGFHSTTHSRDPIGDSKHSLVENLQPEKKRVVPVRGCGAVSMDL